MNKLKKNIYIPWVKYVFQIHLGTLLPMLSFADGKNLFENPLKRFEDMGPKKNGRVCVVDVKHSKFLQALEIESKIEANDWDYQVYLHPIKGVKKDDVLSIHFWARTLESSEPSGQSYIKAAIELPELWKRSEKEQKFLRPLTQNLMITAGKEWKQYFMRARSPLNVPEKEIWLAFRCGLQKQKVQFGDITIINYNKTRKLEDLPQSRVTYTGRETHAPWRKEAEKRIRKLRMRELQILLSDADGKPIPKLPFKLELQRHAFDFGIAFHAMDILPAKNPNYGQIRKKILNNFNAASFLNALKPHAWAGDWIDEGISRPLTLDALEWIAKNKLTFRGHTLVWPRKQSVSDAVKIMLESKNPNPQDIQQTLLNNIRDVGRKTQFWMDEWDVLNEPIPCRDVQEICGDEVMVEWFKEARKILPNVKLAINEYDILSSLTDGKKVGAYEKVIQYLLEHDAPLDVIGFQGHIRACPPPPERILHVLNRFERFGKNFRVTEFDVQTDNEALIHDVTRDFYTLIFSCPQAIGIQIWGMDKVFDDVGNYTALGKAYRELVYNKWMTRVEGKTDENGNFSFRGFLGQYRIVFERDSKLMEKTFELPKGEGMYRQKL